MSRPGTGFAWLIVAGGVAAAVHVGKLPPAIPVLREQLGLTLVEAGFLLSLVQLAGMALGLLVGVAADGVGLKRTMVAGLALTGVASALGAWATSATALLVLRAFEGLGFLLASMPAPALIRRVVEPTRVARMLGLWGAYMPVATAGALLAGPVVLHAWGWPAWWGSLGALALGMAVWLGAALPADEAPVSIAAGAGHKIARTLRHRGPWVVALAFGVYSAQWLSVVGFLPTIYLDAGWTARTASWATAAAAAVNIIGNVASGRLLQRGVPAPWLLAAGFTAMAFGAVLAFADLGGANGPKLRYAGVIAFSMVGGLVPGTLFSLAVRLAPSEGTVSTTVGWMQQWSAFGQFAGPPVVAWAAARAGGWSDSWLVTAACAVAGLVLAWIVARLPDARAH